MGNLQAQLWDKNHDFSHRDLVTSLHAQLDRQDVVAVREPTLGSRWLNQGVVPIPDVLTMKPSYTHPVVTVYEVKASRSDFQADVRVGKWRRYWDLCNRLYFACPSGLLRSDEIPEGAGLITFSKNGNWTVSKGAATHDGGLGEDHLLSLLFSRHRTDIEIRSLEEKRRAFENGSFDSFRLALDLTSAIKRGREAEERDAARRRDIAWALDLPKDKEFSWHKLNDLIREMRQTSALSPAQRKAIVAIDRLANYLARDSTWQMPEAIKTYLEAPEPGDEETAG